jgi:hypothetical protein
MLTAVIKHIKQNQISNVVFQIDVWKSSMVKRLLLQALQVE